MKTKPSFFHIGGENHSPIEPLPRPMKWPFLWLLAHPPSALSCWQVRKRPDWGSVMVRTSRFPDTGSFSKQSYTSVKKLKVGAAGQGLEARPVACSWGSQIPDFEGVLNSGCFILSLAFEMWGKAPRAGCPLLVIVQHWQRPACQVHGRVGRVISVSLSRAWEASPGHNRHHWHPQDRLVGTTKDSDLALARELPSCCEEAHSENLSCPNPQQGSNVVGSENRIWPPPVTLTQEQKGQLDVWL